MDQTILMESFVANCYCIVVIMFGVINTYILITSAKWDSDTVCGNHYGVT